MEQVLFQIGADLLFQNGADLLQIGAVISNRGNYFKSVQNNKYPVWDYENLSSPIQMQLSLKSKTFSDFSNQFPESTSHCKRFEKKDDRHTYFISEITDLKTRLDHSLKNTVLEHRLTVNMLKGPKLL